MPKQKEFLTRKKKFDKRQTNEILESENEYLAAGVDFEETGEKWRAGDAAKSLRFFIRAIETYDAGLQRFPQSFDLAYNKARLQYDIAQQPRLLEHLPTPLIDLLQTAVDSHRIALKIQQDSPDLLFNTAQVLTSLAETITRGRKLPESNRDTALSLLQEALELFQRCLNLQEFKFNQAQEDATQAVGALADADLMEPTGLESNPSNASEGEVWASVEEPTTKSTLFDTAIAQLDTLTTICGLDTSQGHSNLAWLEEYHRTALQDKIKFYRSDPSHQHEASLARAKFISAISDAAFRNARIDLPTYERELNAAFSNPELGLESDPQGLCDRADAGLAFNASIQASITNAQLAELPQLATTCWKHITKALDSLTAASKFPDALNLPRIHLRRGDCEMLRLQLGEAPLCYDLAIKSMPTLVKNAAVYYRGAINIAKRSRDDEEEQKEAEVKEAVTFALTGDTKSLTALTKLAREHAMEIVEEMKDESLLGEESFRKIESLL